MNSPMTLTARLVEIRDVDGAQRYETDGTGHLSSIWLCGSERATDVKVGAVGSLIFRALPTKAYWQFVPLAEIRRR
jgi:hypothetical protein